jgi:hypothetical protein
MTAMTADDKIYPSAIEAIGQTTLITLDRLSANLDDRIVT